jgi:hypothetical protein
VKTGSKILMDVRDRHVFRMNLDEIVRKMVKRGWDISAWHVATYGSQGLVSRPLRFMPAGFPNCLG